MRAFVLVLALVTVSACGRQQPEPSRSSASAPSSPAPADASASRRDQAPAKPRIVFLGDSLTAGLGLPGDRSYPSLIANKLKASGYDYEVVNAGVSGDTSAGGVRRLDWSLEGDVRALVLALGANDGLRGLPTRELKRNLETIIERAKARGVQVILAGMEAPPNNGPEYARDFRQVYADLAATHEIRFLPFLLAGVAGHPSLNQGDGIHPNARGAEMIADLVWSELEPVLRRPN